MYKTDEISYYISQKRICSGRIELLCARTNEKNKNERRIFESHSFFSMCFRSIPFNPSTIYFKRVYNLVFDLVLEFQICESFNYLITYRFPSFFSHDTIELSSP